MENNNGKWYICTQYQIQKKIQEIRKDWQLCVTHHFMFEEDEGGLKFNNCKGRY